MIPWLWAAWMLGYGSVMVSLCVVMILALLFELLFNWIDRRLSK